MQDIYLITGASSDIGLELISNILVSNPNSKIICGSSRINSKLRSLKKDYKDRIEILQLNFLINKQKKNFFDKIKKNKISHFISLAAIREKKSFYNVNELDLIKNFKINYIINIEILLIIIKRMLKNNFGRITFTSSIGTKFGGNKNTFGYSISKFCNEFIPSEAKNWVNKNVFFNCIQIGYTKTSSTSKDKKQFREREKLIPIKRAANPKEIANFIEYISSKKNTFIACQKNTISGGE
mgnify:CR=1 FL=1